jgi:hypothetical protein
VRKEEGGDQPWTMLALPSMSVRGERKRVSKGEEGRERERQDERQSSLSAHFFGRISEIS